LIGTKSDLRNDEATKRNLASKGLAMVTPQDAQTLANELKFIKALECSALTQEGNSATSPIR